MIAAAGSIALTLRYFGVTAPVLAGLAKGRCDSKTMEDKAGDQQRLTTLAFAIGMQVLASRSAQQLLAQLKGSKNKTVKRMHKPVKVLTGVVLYGGFAASYLVTGSDVIGKLRDPLKNGLHLVKTVTCVDALGRTVLPGKSWKVRGNSESFGLFSFLLGGRPSALAKELEQLDTESFWVKHTYNPGNLENEHIQGQRLAAILGDQLGQGISNIVVPEVTDMSAMAKYYNEVACLFESDLANDQTPNLEKSVIKQLKAFSRALTAYHHAPTLQTALNGHDFWKGENESVTIQSDIAIHQHYFDEIKQVLEKMLPHLDLRTDTVIRETTDKKELFTCYQQLAQNIAVDGFTAPKEFETLRTRLQAFVDGLKAMAFPVEPFLKQADVKNIFWATGAWPTEDAALASVHENAEEIRRVLGIELGIDRGVEAPDDTNNPAQMLAYYIDLKGAFEGKAEAGTPAAQLIDKIIEAETKMQALAGAAANDDGAGAAGGLVQEVEVSREDAAAVVSDAAKAAILKQATAYWNGTITARKYWWTDVVKKAPPLLETNLLSQAGAEYIEAQDANLSLTTLNGDLSTLKGQMQYFSAVYTALLSSDDSSMLLERVSDHFKYLTFKQMCSHDNPYRAMAISTGSKAEEAKTLANEQLKDFIFGEEGIRLFVQAMQITQKSDLDFGLFFPPIEGDVARESLVECWKAGFQKLFNMKMIQNADEKPVVAQYANNLFTLNHTITSAAQQQGSGGKGDVVAGGNGDGKIGGGVGAPAPAAAAAATALPEALKALNDGFWKYQDRAAFEAKTTIVLTKPKKNSKVRTRLRTKQLANASKQLRDILVEAGLNMPAHPLKFTQTSINGYWTAVRDNKDLSQEVLEKVNHLIALSTVS